MIRVISILSIHLFTSMSWAVIVQCTCPFMKICLKQNNVLIVLPQNETENISADCPKDPGGYVKNENGTWAQLWKFEKGNKMPCFDYGDWHISPNGKEFIEIWPHSILIWSLGHQAQEISGTDLNMPILRPEDLPQDQFAIYDGIVKIEEQSEAGFSVSNGLGQTHTFNWQGERVGPKPESTFNIRIRAWFKTLFVK